MVHVQISNVGPNDEVIIAPVLRPKDGSLCHPTKTHGEWAVTGRLRPHLYPKHDRPIMIVLEALSKALMADELSELKLPSGKMHGPTPDSMGFTLRRRAELAQIETGEMVQRRNSHRSDDQSIVNEVLYIAQRAVDPSPSPVDDRHATAFAHSPLNHYGLSNIAQRSAHESADSTTDYEGWTPPEQYNGSQG
eukprot:COSAG06_NODE_12458_length_1379_cov_1.157812_3_plen_191_part_01